MQQLMFNGEGRTRVNDICKEAGIPPSLMKTLFHLSPDEPFAMRELADHWGCDASYVTALVDGLEERGLAVRQPHATDRRVKTVALTAAGAEARQRLLDRMWEPPPSFGALNAAEARQLRDLLRKVAAADRLLAAG